jgi:hypothetical protein
VTAVFFFYASSAVGAALFWLLIFKPFELASRYWNDRHYRRWAREHAKGVK